MEQLIINDDELFLDVDFKSLIDQCSLSTGLQMEDMNTDEIFASLFSDGHDQEHVGTTEALYPLEFQAVMLDLQSNTSTSYDGEQPWDDSNVQQNADIIDLPIPKEAKGNEDGIMYQMNPSLFSMIIGDMYVKQQPKANNRVRYECDGSRFLPDSRYHPMALSLPELQSIVLQSNQQLGIVTTMISDTYNGKFVHANDIVYRVDGAIKVGYACAFVPLDGNEMKNGEKKFPRLSIMYKKCDEFSFDLTPFDPLSMFGETRTYTTKNERNIGIAAKAKLFKEDYNLLSYKFVFHLALKQDNVVYISNIVCETDTINEEKAPTTSSKRSASVAMDSVFEDDNISDNQPSRPLKKVKLLSPQNVGLPVTRIFNDSA